MGGTQGQGEPPTLQTHTWGSVPPPPGWEPQGKSPPWGHASSPVPCPRSIGGEGSRAGGKARCTELAGWKQGHGAAGAARSHACPQLPGTPAATSMVLGGRDCGGQRVPSWQRLWGPHTPLSPSRSIAFSGSVSLQHPLPHRP